ncbi:penicillin acylase family protein [Pontibaca methylaminivorans]|uniref:penicillin acylase family protein n=1 Tax=Pontibaca methylaminivorans TaxID=515897 RepID=UPI002FDA8B22
MKLLFRWLLRLATVLVVLTGAAVLLAYYLASRSLPDYDQTLRVEGIAAPVEIVRDTADVPHILGETDPDVFFGLGYAHAQDRLWQMTVMRRTVQGRLSEVFGPRSLATDRLMRRLDLHRLARQSLAAQDDYTKAALRAYAAGVNARLDEINERALGRGAPEMFIFNAPIAPWQAADSIALAKLMAFRATGQMSNEILRARTALALDDPARLADLMPDAPGEGLAALPDYAGLFNSLPRHAELGPAATGKAGGDFLSPLAPPALAGASNGWSAAPSRSAAGGTLLANDPHLALSAPSIWYLARLELGTGGVIGATIPGIPVVLSGRSGRLGWGITSAYLDDQDLFIEELNPDNPEEYRTPEGYKPFDSRPSIIEIRGEKPVTLTLRWSENGPVLPRDLRGLAAITPRGHVVTLGWTGLNPEDTSLSAAMAVMRARSTTEAIRAGERHVAPAQNLQLADADGVAMKMIGAAPRRDPAHQTEGRLPSPGWHKENRWLGTLPYADNPEFIDPAGGIVGNTNNKTVDRPFPDHVSYLWGDSQRIQRWTHLMQRREVHTRESFIEAQLDTVSFTARSLLPLIGADLWFTEKAAPEGTLERRRQTALRLLSEWNGDMNEHMPEPLIHAAWLRALQDRLIRDELGPLADDFTHVEPLFIERVFRDIDGASAWCNVRHSARTETCSEMARLALDDALIWIGEHHGTTLESLRWGDAHLALQDHPVLGEVPLLRHFVNIRQSTGGGDNTLQRGVTLGSGPAPFRNVHAAGYRGVYDFADPDSSVFVISTGQSGHFLSGHYDDLSELWRRGEYVPMSLDLDLARAGSVGTTHLLPRQ